MASLPFTHKAIQGFQIAYTVPIVDDNGNAIAFTGSEPLTAAVWSGGQQATVFAPSVAWNSGPLGLIDITYSPSNTATVPIGFYEVLISRTDVVIALASGYLEVVPAPGTSTADLCTIPYARMALASFTFTLPQLDFLPYAITLVSNAIKRYCGDRDFVQQDYVKEYEVYLDGTIMVDQLPLNQVKRIQASPCTALTITNSLSGASDAWTYFTFTGDASTTQTCTGISLNVINGGIQTTTSILFTAGETINALATAISAAGNGWSAVGDSTYGVWPVTELLGTERPGGALNLTDEGATYDVYGEDLGADVQVECYRTGVVRVGRQYRGTGPKWGPDWAQFDSPYIKQGRVKVTYNAGYATIPTDVQWCVADLTKRLLILAQTDPVIQAESIEQYSTAYRQVLDLMTAAHRQVLSVYRIHHA